MNVSSVKNLNGETFSAVQDAYLTDVVSNNSANWNEISAYQANSGNYQLTADMTAYANSAEVTGTAQYGLTTAGWSEITGGGSVPTGVMTESGLEYDASGNISAYSGSAFATQLPEEEEVEFEELDITSISAATDYVSANSANIDATVTNVSANSGAWGGSALPVSAGKGVKISLQNDTLVFENDETLLFEGNALHNYATAALSEPFTNFEKIKIYGHTDDGVMYPWFTEVPTFNGIGFIGIATNNAGWSKWFGLSVPDTTHIVPHTGYVMTWASTTTGYLNNTWGITRVVGINRTAGGN